MNIAVLGLGQMGAQIAQRLLDKGHTVTVWNRTPERGEPLVAAGASAVASPAEVWSSASLAITMLYDDAALRDVYIGNGLVAGAPKGALLIDMSTVSTETSAEVAKACDERGVRFLRGPVSGGPARAGEGALTILASGPQGAYDEALPVLNDLGTPTLLGPAEEGRTVKLAVNLILAGLVQLLAEAVVLGDAGGVERRTLMDALISSAVGSQLLKARAPVVIEREYATPNFTVAGMLKDVELITSAAATSGVSLPASEQVSDLLKDAIDRGLGELSYVALLPRLQAANNLPADV